MHKLCDILQYAACCASWTKYENKLIWNQAYQSIDKDSYSFYDSIEADKTLPALNGFILLLAFDGLQITRL